ncbi:23S rRNA (guanosine(2251)-2'-O)-methyltransferase RlmB [Marinoscillum sp. MHG1-6]|uniref:23S rRNA (guanosine(2251)-2'-O)-methyltransferase RlmB n=1 Tax=Marinoscillum sp. MHG1-6 TaxID=2959627 RepID=UPI0021583A7F|nr:23S rRNA (guanosine(2251)-2'-O)-methyltransferase RlmB [Marinoscillum sp. MHG1-6]
MAKQLENLIYGIRAIIETIQAGKDLEKVFVQKGLKGDLIKELLNLAHERTIPVSTVPIEKINRFTRKNHQGAVALVSPVQYHKLDQVLPGLFEQGLTPMILMLDRITDVRNFGAIARSAECMGAHAIVIPTKNGAQINADAVKTSAGALNFLPVCRERNLMDSLRFLQDSGLQVISCSEKGKQLMKEADFTLPCVIVMGNEEEGVSPEILSLSDEVMQIPMTGQIASLNVSAAAAMMLYEAANQRLEYNIK